MRYFVTGATGFIGGHLARQLVAAGHEVVALVRSRARSEDLVRAGIGVHEGDITDKDSLQTPMRGVDGVFHLAAWYRVGARNHALAEAINVGGTRNVLEVMRDLGVPRGVYTSTLNVFGDTGGQLVDESFRRNGPWLSEYDRTKWIAHYEVAEPMMREGLPLIIVQPGGNYGPGDASPIHDLIVRYLTRTLHVVPERAAYCWGHVEDTARGHLLAMERGRPGASYIIAGPAHTAVGALAIAERLTGIPAPRLRLGPGTLRALAALVRPVERIVPVPEFYASETLEVMAEATYLGSSAKAKRELGFTARPLAEGLRETLRYERKRLEKPPERS